MDLPAGRWRRSKRSVGAVWLRGGTSSRTAACTYCVHNTGAAAYSSWFDLPLHALPQLAKRSTRSASSTHFPAARSY